MPQLLDAIKAELNRQTVPGRYVITGSTRYEHTAVLDSRRSIVAAPVDTLWR